MKKEGGTLGDYTAGDKGGRRERKSRRKRRQATKPRKGSR